MAEAQTTQAENAAPETPKKRRAPPVRTGPSVTADRILLKAHTMNLEELRAFLVPFKPSPLLLKRVRKLSEEYQQPMAASLVAYMDERGVNNVTPGARGKKAPGHNDRRTYNVQVIKKQPDTPFVRVPLNVLGLTKGDKVRVAFMNDRIILKRPKAAGATDAAPVEGATDEAEADA